MPGVQGGRCAAHEHRSRDQRLKVAFGRQQPLPFTVWLGLAHGIHDTAQRRVMMVAQDNQRECGATKLRATFGQGHAKNGS